MHVVNAFRSPCPIFSTVSSEVTIAKISNLQRHSFNAVKTRTITAQWPYIFVMSSYLAWHRGVMCSVRSSCINNLPQRSLVIRWIRCVIRSWCVELSPMRSAWLATPETWNCWRWSSLSAGCLGTRICGRKT